MTHPLSITLNIANIYAPAQRDSPEKKAFYDTLPIWPLFSTGSTIDDWILLGEFNINIHNTPLPGWMRTWEEWHQTHFINCGPDYSYTFCSGDHRSTINYIFGANSLQSRIVNFNKTYLPATWTDHYLLCMDYLLDRIEIGPGCWRLNPHLLTNTEFQQCLTTTTQIFFQQYPVDLANNAVKAWDDLKSILQLTAKDFCRRYQATQTSTISRLQQEHTTLLLAHVSNLTPSVPGAPSRLREVEAELDGHTDRLTAQLLLRSATRWEEKGERNNKVFFRVIKERQNQQTIRSLQIDGSTDRARGPNSILRTARRFY